MRTAPLVVAAATAVVWMSHVVAHAQTATARPAQRGVAQFVAWQPKAGQEATFEAGYRQHLQWHKAAGDTWRWYGWIVATGPRQGLFIDATLDHAWADFDKPLRPADDGADNQVHVEPFGDVRAVYKAVALDDLSLGATSGLTSKIVRHVTLSLASVAAAADASRVLARLKADYQARLGIKHLLVFRVVDGGEHQLELFFGFDTQDASGKVDGLLDDLAAIQRALKVDVFRSVSSETWRYRADMSLLPS